MGQIVPRDNSTYEKIERKIKALDVMAWADKWGHHNDQYGKWLQNFQEANEQLYAMFLLSKFMYYNNDSIREMMIRVYNDLYRRPIIYEIRRENHDVLDPDIIESKFKKINKKTRFLSLGNPSESSAHLLYYFRQENLLKKDLFISPHELFTYDQKGEQIIAVVDVDGIDRIVILDDFCGSGDQAKDFNDKFVKPLKANAPQIKVLYYSLFAIETGLNVVKDLLYDDVQAIFVLDESYKCFSEQSRFFSQDLEIKRECMNMCVKYGEQWGGDPLGYNGCQMLLGFHHNTPNNTLPIFWREKNWTPIFKRYAKLY